MNIIQVFPLVMLGLLILGQILGWGLRIYSSTKMKKLYPSVKYQQAMKQLGICFYKDVYKSELKFIGNPFISSLLIATLLVDEIEKYVKQNLNISIYDLDEITLISDSLFKSVSFEMKYNGFIEQISTVNIDDYSILIEYAKYKKIFKKGFEVMIITVIISSLLMFINALISIAIQKSLGG